MKRLDRRLAMALVVDAWPKAEWAMLKKTVLVGSESSLGSLPTAVIDWQIIDHLSRLGYVTRNGDVTALTDTGRAIAKDWVRNPNHPTVFAVPIAKFDFQLTGVIQLNDVLAQADLDCRWVPTPVGAEMMKFDPYLTAEVFEPSDKGLEPKKFKAAAQFQKYDDGWRVVDVVQR